MSRLLNQKKAVVEVQFNWIFVLIAGGLILLLFGGFIARQKIASEQKLHSQILADLEAVLTGASVSTGAAELIEIPDMNLAFNCDEYVLGEIRKPVSEAIPLFSPNLIEGLHLLTWSREFNVPFKVTNFLYLTSPNVRYIFIGDSDFAETVFEELPPIIIEQDEEEKLAMNKELISPSEVDLINDLNNYKVKLIYFVDAINPDIRVPDELEDMNDEDVTAIAIKADDFDQGEIGFYLKFGETFELDGEQSSFLGDASLFGAIFSETAIDYECTMEKAFMKYEVVLNIYKKRIQEIMNNQHTTQTCSDHYDVNDFDTLLGFAKLGFEPDKTQFFRTSINSIGLRNQNLKRASCALIY